MSHMWLRYVAPLGKPVMATNVLALRGFYARGDMLRGWREVLTEETEMCIMLRFAPQHGIEKERNSLS